jgi:hypothetical protein
MATNLPAGNRRAKVPLWPGQEILSFLSYGARDTIMQWIPEALSPGVKRPWRETDHLPLTNVDVINGWKDTSTPPHIFLARCLIKDRYFTSICVLYKVNEKSNFLCKSCLPVCLSVADVMSARKPLNILSSSST